MTAENRGRAGGRSVLLLKRLLLGLWAAWMTVVFATNLLDAAKALGLLSESWAFASGNFRSLAETTARYGTPAWLDGFLFAGVIAWEGAAALLFWLAWGTFRGRGKAGARLLYAAFTVGLTLWLAFAVADEAFVSYPVEATHLRLFIAQLVTLLAVELLPEEPSPRPGGPT
ncbi:MAG TPA: hypothetical protein VKD72_26080 [Gemmataceae bacterium]|nr:hypothetical protein [Gemmataceae bacterium]